MNQKKAGLVESLLKVRHRRQEERFVHLVLGIETVIDLFIAERRHTEPESKLLGGSNATNGNAVLHREATSQVYEATLEHDIQQQGWLEDGLLGGIMLPSDGEIHPTQMLEGPFNAPSTVGGAPSLAVSAPYHLESGQGYSFSGREEFRSDQWS